MLRLALKVSVYLSPSLTVRVPGNPGQGYGQLANFKLTRDFKFPGKAWALLKGSASAQDRSFITLRQDISVKHSCYVMQDV